MQQLAHELALAARLRLHAQAEAHRRFVQSQHKDTRATFIYNLSSAYDRIDRYKRLQGGEKPSRSPQKNRTDAGSSSPPVSASTNVPAAAG